MISIIGCVFDDAVSMGAYHIDIHRPAGTWVDSHNVRAGLLQGVWLADAANEIGCKSRRLQARRPTNRAAYAAGCSSMVIDSIAGSRIISRLSWSSVNTMQFSLMLNAA